jgi:prolipoprotein diacylglyceryl transferase
VTDGVLYLATIPSPTQGVWHLGPFPIRAYALCIILGIIAACAITEVRLRQRGAPKWLVLDVAIFAVLAGIVGARLYHVITTPGPYFGSNGHLIDALYVWNGGLGIWGGVGGGALGAWFGCRRAGVPLSLFADALAPGLPVAQAIGRFGNWFNNELYGGHTSLPWGLTVYKFGPDGQAMVDADGKPILEPGGPFHPTFLYEALWDVGVAVLVYLVDRKYKFGRGRAFALYVMAYTAGRFWVEALRTDTALHILGMRLNDWVSIIVFIGALIFFLRVRGPREHIRIEPDGALTVVTEEGEPIDWRKPAEGRQAIDWRKAIEWLKPPIGPTGHHHGDADDGESTDEDDDDPGGGSAGLGSQGTSRASRN